jgi:hypothetical protein
MISAKYCFAALPAHDADISSFQHGIEQVFRHLTDIQMQIIYRIERLRETLHNKLPPLV